jgi:hypothetical protein
MGPMKFKVPIFLSGYFRVCCLFLSLFNERFSTAQLRAYMRMVGWLQIIIRKDVGSGRGLLKLANLYRRLGYGLDDRIICVRFLAGRSFHHHHVQIGSGAYSASSSVGTGGFPPRVKRPRRKDVGLHLLPRLNTGSCPSISHMPSLCDVMLNYAQEPYVLVSQNASRK